MRGEQDVARRRAQEGEALLEVLKRVWVFAAVREAKAVGRHGRHAVGVNEVQAAPAFARAPGPTRSAGCVAGREVCPQFDVADAKRLAVAQGLDARDERQRRDASELRVALADAAPG